MNRKITLSTDQQRQFEVAIKRGILKELHRDKMLTDTQISLLLSNIWRNIGNAPFVHLREQLTLKYGCLQNRAGQSQFKQCII